MGPGCSIRKHSAGGTVNLIPAVGAPRIQSRTLIHPWDRWTERHTHVVTIVAVRKDLATCFGRTGENREVNRNDGEILRAIGRTQRGNTDARIGEIKLVECSPQFQI